MTTYKCSECDYTSPKGNVERHIRTTAKCKTAGIIVTPGTVSCDRCDSVFTLQVSLKNHKKICGIPKIKNPEILDKNKIALRECIVCSYDSNEVDFYMNDIKTKYENPRCVECQSKYRHELKAEGATYNKFAEYMNNIASCRRCKKTRDDGLIFTFETIDNEKKVYHTVCKDCRICDDIKERICHKCENSSIDVNFDIYTASHEKYYHSYCVTCKEYNDYIKYIKNNNIEEIFCEHCECSSLTNIFSHSGHRNVNMSIYCKVCELIIEKIICTDCKKSYTKCTNKRSTGTYNNLVTRLLSYKRSAELRGHVWQLSDQEAYNMFIMNCEYCALEGISGIDRVNNNIGYILSNCVPCCKTCNIMKGQLTLKLFQFQCEEIHEKLRKKRLNNEESEEEEIENREEEEEEESGERESGEGEYESGEGEYESGERESGEGESGEEDEDFKSGEGDYRDEEIKKLKQKLAEYEVKFNKILSAFQ
jgi:hypothetical protein